MFKNKNGVADPVSALIIVGAFIVLATVGHEMDLLGDKVSESGYNVSSSQAAAFWRP